MRMFRYSKGLLSFSLWFSGSNNTIWYTCFATAGNRLRTCRIHPGVFSLAVHRKRFYHRWVRVALWVRLHTRRVIWDNHKVLRRWIPRARSHQWSGQKILRDDTF